MRLTRKLLSKTKVMRYSMDEARKLEVLRNFEKV